MSRYLNVKKKKKLGLTMCKDTQVAEKKHIISSSSTVEDSQDLQSCSPNYINIEHFIKMNDSSFA